MNKNRTVRLIDAPIVQSNPHQSCSPQAPAITRPFLLPRTGKYNISAKNPTSINDSRNRGNAFLKPYNSNSAEYTRKYFRQIPTKEELIKLVQDNQNIIPLISTQLNFSPSTYQGYVNYIVALNPENEDHLVKIRAIIQNALPDMSPNSKNIPRFISSVVPSFPEEKFELNDIRYVEPLMERSIICGPVVLGMIPQDFNVSVPLISGDQRIIIQSFMGNVSPHVSKWPNTLEVYVNKKLVKPPGIYFFPIIDITSFGPVSEIRIVCQKEVNSFSLLIRVAGHRSLDEIIKELYNAPPVQEVFRESELSLLCPFTGMKIKYPGKGRYCNHAQTFDLKNFLRIALNQRRWVCPICNRSLNFSDLIYSHETKKLLNAFSQTPPENPVMEQNDNAFFVDNFEPEPQFDVDEMNVGF